MPRQATTNVTAPNLSVFEGIITYRGGAPFLKDEGGRLRRFVEALRPPFIQLGGGNPTRLMRLLMQAMGSEEGIDLSAILAIARDTERLERLLGGAPLADRLRLAVILLRANADGVDVPVCLGCGSLMAAHNEVFICPIDGSVTLRWTGDESLLVREPPTDVSQPFPAGPTMCLGCHAKMKWAGSCYVCEGCGATQGSI